GINDYVEIPDNETLSFGKGSFDYSFSVAAWIYMEDRNNFIIFGKDEYPINREFDLRMVGDGYLHFYTLDHSQGAWIGRKSTEMLQNNRWYHVVGTYDGSGSNSGFKLYVNGAQVDDMDYFGGSYVAMENTASNLYIGRQAGIYSDGLIDEVAIWDEVLSQYQIYDMYTSENHYKR
ncbi:MAG: LamG domain-containing protein, partial [Candidatus Thermoplasmatota archaeon]|nr:LamG domain-containing protein [Candidatus Thermoplasmatota archaeon]